MGIVCKEIKNGYKDFSSVVDKPIADAIKNPKIKATKKPISISCSVTRVCSINFGKSI